MVKFRGSLVVLALAFSAGCASIVGIDEIVIVDDDGSSSSGGSTSTSTSGAPRECAVNRGEICQGSTIESLTCTCTLPSGTKSCVRGAGESDPRDCRNVCPRCP